MAFTNLIHVAELVDLLAHSPQGVVLLDCRFDLARPDAGRQAYLAGHIPGARFADLNHDLAAPVTADSGRHPVPEPDRLLQFCESAGITPESQVVAYDAANGSLAARAWWLLRWLGHARTAVLEGGYEAWITAGGRAEPGDAGPGHARARRLQRRDGEGFAMIGTDEVMRALRDDSSVLVDARAPDRYAGAVEPIDPVAGHVPGAINHPFSRNLDEQNRFLPPDELRRRWLETLNGKDSRTAILMCGSGVTACHNALAMEIAGLPGAKLYAGSWSEWIRDAARPIARGANP